VKVNRQVRRLRILAVASGGGHWAQLLRVQDAFVGEDVTFVTVHAGYGRELNRGIVRVVADANQHRPFRILLLAIQVVWLLVRERPDVIISTGAAPGCLAVVFGRLCGARTIWLDSIANIDRISLSGRVARPFADLWLTQWPHLAAEGGPECAGRVF